MLAWIQNKQYEEPLPELFSMFLEALTKTLGYLCKQIRLFAFYEFWLLCHNKADCVSRHSAHEILDLIQTFPGPNSTLFRCSHCLYCIAVQSSPDYDDDYSNLFVYKLPGQESLIATLIYESRELRWPASLILHWANLGILGIPNVDVNYHAKVL